MHHADLEFDVTTGLRFHPGEIVLPARSAAAIQTTSAALPGWAAASLLVAFPLPPQRSRPYGTL
jgi:sterol desaturase/sphingolipid hydroxylase (fatty acid hydroxylase superfamily)